MKTYYISDLHFGHKNIIRYDNRPFKNVEEHDEEIIKRWNNTVKQDDEVYILGDISWYSPQKTVEIFNRLHGIKHLLVGNHDHKLLKSKQVRDLFVEINDYKEIKLPDNKGIVLSHYPIPCFNKHYHGWIHLYAHVHNSFEANMMESIRREMIELYDKPCDMFNVGCMLDYMNYTPRTLEQIIASNGIELK